MSSSDPMPTSAAMSWRSAAPSIVMLFGKAVMLAWIGRPFTRFFGNGPLSHPAVAVLIGGAIVLALYTIPVLGILVYKLLSWLGLGVVVYTLILAARREKTAANATAAAAAAASAAAAGAMPVTEPPVAPVPSTPVPPPPLSP